MAALDYNIVAKQLKAHACIKSVCTVYVLPMCVYCLVYAFNLLQSCRVFIAGKISFFLDVLLRNWAEALSASLCF
jgi:hypothetical protein